MRDHLLSDAAGIASDAGGIKGDRAEEMSRRG
jgi:hypothetical protein